MKKILFIIAILFLFALGPLGFLSVLDTSVSLKYEVDEPRNMGLEKNNDLTILENQLNRRLFFYWTVTAIGPMTAIALLIRKSKRKTTANE